MPMTGDRQWPAPDNRSRRKAATHALSAPPGDQQQLSSYPPNAIPKLLQTCDSRKRTMNERKKLHRSRLLPLPAGRRALLALLLGLAAASAQANIYVSRDA